MVKCPVSHSELQAEENFGMTECQVQFYQVDLVRVRDMENLSMGAKSYRTHLFNIHWYQRVDLI